MGKGKVQKHIQSNCASLWYFQHGHIQIYTYTNTHLYVVHTIQQ